MIRYGDRRQPSYAWAFDRGDGLANVGYGELLPGERDGDQAPEPRGCCSSSSSGCCPGAATTGTRLARPPPAAVSGWRWRPARRAGAARRRRRRAGQPDDRRGHLLRRRHRHRRRPHRRAAPAPTGDPTAGRARAPRRRAPAARPPPAPHLDRLPAGPRRRGSSTPASAPPPATGAVFDALVEIGLGDGRITPASRRRPASGWTRRRRARPSATRTTHRGATMQILSVRGALPRALATPQAEITEAFAEVIAAAAASTSALLRRFHANAGVERRHLVLPLEEYAELGDFGAAPTTCSSSTPSSSASRALVDALKAAGLTPDRRRPRRLRHRHRAGRALARRPDRRAGRAAPGRQADAAGRARLRRRRRRHRPAARLPARPPRRRRRAGRGRAVLADRAARRRLGAQPGGQRAVRRRRRAPWSPAARRRPATGPVRGARLPAAGSTPTPSGRWASTSAAAGCGSCSTPRCPTLVERYLRERRRRASSPTTSSPATTSAGGSATPAAPR